MLDAVGIDAGYGAAQVLWSTSLSVGANEIVGILGPNGAGKSTLINCLSGLVPLKAGSLSFLGSDFTRLPAHKRVSLGLSLVLERRRLFALMTVRENLLV